MKAPSDEERVELASLLSLLRTYGPRISERLARFDNSVARVEASLRAELDTGAADAERCEHRILWSAACPVCLDGLVARRARAIKLGGYVAASECLCSQCVKAGIKTRPTQCECEMQSSSDRCTRAVTHRMPQGSPGQPFFYFYCEPCARFRASGAERVDGKGFDEWGARGPDCEHPKADSIDASPATQVKDSLRRRA